MRYKNILLAVFGTVIMSQQMKAQLKVGDKAPDIIFSAALDQSLPQGFNKGKYLVLDFWATWCGPCIASFPKLNEYKKKYSSEDVLFASITNDPEEKIKKFLTARKTVRLDLIKLIDEVDKEKFPEGKTFTNFKAQFIPMAVIIAPDQTITWVGASHNLTEEILLNALNKQPLTQTQPVPSPSVTNPVITPKAAIVDTFSISGFRIITGQVPAPKRSAAWNNYPEKGKINTSWSGEKINHILHLFYKLPNQQVVLVGTTEETIPIVKYNIKRELGTTWDSLAYITSEVLSKKYGFTYKIEEREKEVWQLTLTDTKKLLKNAAAFDSSSGKGGTGVQENNMFSLNALFHNLKELIETYYTTEFFEVDALNAAKVEDIKFDFYIPLNDMTAATAQLNNYGIKVKKVKKKIPFLILDFTSAQRLRGR